MWWKITLDKTELYIKRKVCVKIFTRIGCDKPKWEYMYLQVSIGLNQTYNRHKLKYRAKCKNRVNNII